MNNASADDNDLRIYMEIARRQPYLELEEEQALARRWLEGGDRAARDRLHGSHLRLVARIAMRMRGYGVSLGDLIKEGEIGLLRAIDKFDASKGFRLSTYAQWWIRAAMQDFVLRNSSIVKVMSSPGQKNLFFGLKRIKADLGIDGDNLTPSQIAAIAANANATEGDVVIMNARLSRGGDASLNQTVESGDEIGDMLQSTDPSPFDLVANDEIASVRTRLIHDSLQALTERERHIVRERHLADRVMTLEELGDIYGVTRERIRQIEVAALKKIAQHIRIHNSVPAKFLLAA